MKSLLLATVLAVAAILPAKAAEIGVGHYRDTGNAFIYIIGDITIGDAGRFRAAAARMPKGTSVTLASNGGKTFEAMEIGTLTRQRGFVTYVSDGHYCVSACGLIWLAGTERIAGTKAAIGFHASVDTRTGLDSGYGNASIGSYLARLGYSDNAIFYATNQPHDKVEWLHADAAQYGITWRSIGN